MKKKKIITTAVIVVLVIALIIAAISLLKKDNFGMTSAQRNAAVAVVGGSEKITANEFAIDLQNYIGNIDQYNMYALYYGIGTYRDPSDKDAIREEKLHELIEERAYVAIAREFGITLSSEEKKEAEEAGKKAYDNLVEQYTNQYSQYGYADPKSYAVSSVAEYFSKSGIGSKSKFIQRNTVTEEASKLRTKVIEKLKEDSNITDDQAEELYPDWVSFYEGYYSEGMIATYDNYFIQGNQKIRYLYIPEEGFVFVRVIALDDEARANEMVEQIGTDAEKFEEFCMSEENNDGLMPLVAPEDSYAISENDSSFDAAVYEAAKEMNVGDIKLVVVTTAPEAEETDEESEEPAEPAEPVTTYYIIRRVEGATGFTPFEKVKDVVVSDVISDAKDKYADKYVHEWMENEGNVVINENVLATVKVD